MFVMLRTKESLTYRLFITNSKEYASGSKSSVSRCYRLGGKSHPVARRVTWRRPRPSPLQWLFLQQASLCLLWSSRQEHKQKPEYHMYKHVKAITYTAPTDWLAFPSKGPRATYEMSPWGPRG